MTGELDAVLAPLPEGTSHGESPSAESVAGLFEDVDSELDRTGEYPITLFDAFDHCSDEWQDTVRPIRGWLPLAVDMRSFRRRRLKILADMDDEIAAPEHRSDKARAIKQGMMQQPRTGSIRKPIPDDKPEGGSHDA